MRLARRKKTMRCLSVVSDLSEGGEIMEEMNSSSTNLQEEEQDKEKGEEKGKVEEGNTKNINVSGKERTCSDHDVNSATSSGNNNTMEEGSSQQQQQQNNMDQEQSSQEHFFPSSVHVEEEAKTAIHTNTAAAPPATAASTTSNATTNNTKKHQTFPSSSRSTPDTVKFSKTNKTYRAPPLSTPPSFMQYDNQEEGELVAVKIFKKSLLKECKSIECESHIVVGGNGGNGGNGGYGGGASQLQVHTALENVEREIALMKMIQHPNLVCLYEVIDSAETDRLFMVLEYVECGEIMTHVRGTDRYRRSLPQQSFVSSSSSSSSNSSCFKKVLGKRLSSSSSTINTNNIFGVTEGGYFDEVHAALYFVDVMHGLAHLHRHCIVHRDLKPEVGFNTMRVKFFFMCVCFCIEFNFDFLTSVCVNIPL